MKKTTSILVLIALLSGCASTVNVTDDEVRRVVATLDYGDSTSVTLAGKAWEAYKDNDYLELFAYTQRCAKV